MKWGSLLGLLVVVMLMSVLEWPKLKQKKERISFAVITSVGFGLTALLLFHPDLPGPTQWIDAIYRPLGKILER